MLTVCFDPNWPKSRSFGRHIWIIWQKTVIKRFISLSSQLLYINCFFNNHWILFSSRKDNGEWYNCVFCLQLAMFPILNKKQTTTSTPKLTPKCFKMTLTVTNHTVKLVWNKVADIIWYKSYAPYHMHIMQSCWSFFRILSLFGLK